MAGLTDFFRFNQVTLPEAQPSQITDQKLPREKPAALTRNSSTGESLKQKDAPAKVSSYPPKSTNKPIPSHCIYEYGVLNPAMDTIADPMLSIQMELVYKLLCTDNPCEQIEFRQNSSNLNSHTLFGGHSTSFIRYNNQHMLNIAYAYGMNAIFGMLAHQLGHIIASKEAVRRINKLTNKDDFFLTGEFREAIARDLEKKADHYAGCALARAGIPIFAMDAALNQESYYLERINYVKSGYQDCTKKY